MLSVSDLLGDQVRQVKEVELPKRGGSVFVRVLSVREALQQSNEMRDESDVANIIATKLAAYLSDASGKPLLTLEQARALLDSMSMIDASAILDAGNALNSINAEGIEATKKD